MILKLVLDENIIELSAKVKNDQGEDDPTCSILITTIYKNNDLLNCNDELYQKYSRKLKELEKRIPSSVYTRKMLLNLLAKGLIKFENFCPAINKENLLPSDDVFIIRLVVRTKSTLVSTDTPLKEKMEEAKIMSTYGISYQRPEEVYSKT